MRTGAEGIKLIKNFEGCRLKAYKPVAAEKQYTIGWGHYGVPAGTVWTQKQADDQLVKDLVKYETYVNNLKKQWTQNQFDALVSFTYNCGPGYLAKLVKGRNNAQIADALLKYTKDASGKTLAGLERRRKMERELFLKGGQVTEKSGQASGQVAKLPYKVKTKCDLNIRYGAGEKFEKIRTAKKGEILMVWAEVTVGKSKWGKNGTDHFCLDYCERV